MPLLWVVIFICLVIAPTPARAFTVGAIVPQGDRYAAEAHAALVNATGNTDKIDFMVQSPGPDIVAMKNATRKLLTLKVNMLITYGSTATLSALGENPKVPVLFVGVFKPLRKRLNRKNSTGVCVDPPLPGITRFVSGTSRSNRIGIIFCSHEKTSTLQASMLMSLLKTAGKEPVPIDLKVSTRTTPILSGADVEYFVLTDAACVIKHGKTIAMVAENRKIPSATLLYIDELDPVIAYYPDAAEAGQMAAEQLGNTRRGFTKPDDTAKCSSRAELIFNVGKAGRLGLNIPMELVTGATKVIY